MSHHNMPQEHPLLKVNNQVSLYQFSEKNDIGACPSDYDPYVLLGSNYTA